MDTNEVYIHLSRSEYNPGEVVTGAILLKLGDPIRVTGILLKLSGKERSSWIEAKKGQAEPVSVQRPYFKTVVQVATFPSHEDHVGEFRFPFSFTLPRNIPGSCAYTFGSVSSSIIYKVKAVVQQLGIEKSLLNRSEHVHVKQMNPLNQVLARNDPPANYCLCIPQPGIAIEVALDRQAYHAGDTIRLISTINNGTTHLIDLVTVSLRMHVNLTSFSWSDLTLSQRRQYTIDQVISTANFPSIQAKSDIPYCELPISVPDFVRQHCFGHTVRIFYSIELKVHVRGASASTADSTRIPVAIYHTDTSLTARPGPGFDPTTYQGVVGHLPSTIPGPAAFPMFAFKNIAPLTSTNPGPIKNSNMANRIAYPAVVEVYQEPTRVVSVAPEPLRMPEEDHKMEQATPLSPVTAKSRSAPTNQTLNEYAAA